MIRKVQVKNYKSIADLTLDPGRVTVLIGPNGSGKSNILEAIALAGASGQDRLGNEFLISRGIRVTETRFMRSAFEGLPSPQEASQSSSSKKNGTQSSTGSITISVRGEDDVHCECELFADETGSFPKWKSRLPAQLISDSLARLREERGDSALLTSFLALEQEISRRLGPLPEFLVYAPENSALRTFQAEGQILPLGIRGEGLFAHLKALGSQPFRDRLARIKEGLQLIGWFEDFEIPEDLGPGERSIRIRDRYLRGGALFDQRSANEGFLFLLFYMTLFISPDTPAFFSIDNIDTSLNPKLCTALVRQIVVLAREYDKQVILTTHNPAVLDGLDLHDEEQRLFIVDRNKAGYTRVHRVEAPQPVAGQPVMSLSEAFLRGFIGGLPKNF